MAQVPVEKLEKRRISPCPWDLSPKTGPKTVQVSSNGIQRTLTFFPGVEHGAVRVEGEPDADLGFRPATQRYHILHLGSSSGKAWDF